MRKVPYKTLLADVLFITLGCLVFAAAVSLFLEPARISPGGFAGIGVIINSFLGIGTGLVVFLLNLPLFVICFIYFGGGFLYKTVASVLLCSFFLDILSLFPPVANDRILCALFGGILSGAGLSLVMMRGATTGGMDTLSSIIHTKKPSVSVGKVLRIGDMIVITLSAFTYGDINSALYSVLAIYISSTVLDSLLYGSDRGKILFVISKEYKDISSGVLYRIGRGVTKVPITGGYTENQRVMLMCALRRYEVAPVKAIIKEADASAFVIVCDAGHISGEGFRPRE